MNNNCIHLRIRSKKYNKYSYCIKNKKEITFEDCQNCKYKEYKKVKPLVAKTPLKQRSSKQNKLERNRYSIFTDNFDKCIECPNVKNLKVDKHEIFRGRNRLNSIKWGLVIPLCRGCHNDPEIERKWRLKGYNKFVELHGKEKFIEVFKYIKGINI
jgi:hypothetical protein